ncbi:MAG: Uma2 family endonuclease [Anaerolineae bacterium]|nr:Uma2 family endonuclease [Anaerolineae bacterium]
MQIQEMVYTVDDLLRLSQSADYAAQRLDLSDGRLIVMSPASWKHGMFTALLAHLIRSFSLEHDLGMVTGAETGYILHRAAHPGERDTVRAPDVGFIAKARLPAVLPETGFVPFAPDLAVEVVSPNDDPEEIHIKMADYLKHGTRLVWLFYPKSATVGVYTPNHFQVLERAATLEGGAVLPGFRLPLDEVFK